MGIQMEQLKATKKRRVWIRMESQTTVCKVRLLAIEHEAYFEISVRGFNKIPQSLRDVKWSALSKKSGEYKCVIVDPRGM